MMPNTPRVVVFDAVGTLIFPQPTVSAVYTAAGRRHGSKLDESEVARRFHAVFCDVERRDRAGDMRTNEQLELARWQEIVRRVLDDVTDLAACFRELFVHFARPESWRVFPDVSEAFRRLTEQGVSLAVASNFDERLFEIARHLPPLDHCEHVLVSSRIGHRKPHRRFFEAVIESVAEAPNEVLFVGDDRINDVAGAESAGVIAVLLQRSGAAAGSEISSLDQLLVM